MTFSMIDWSVVALYIARGLALLIAIPFHESAHAWASSRLGDPTAKNLGRMSMNPLRHFDPLGALCMILVGFGWAKPVPVTIGRGFRNPKRDMALSAAAGPASNLLLAFLFMIFYKLILLFAPATAFWYFIYTVVFTMIQVNVTLAVFNLLPIPPLDGSRIFNLILPDSYYFLVMRYERYIFIGLFALVFSGLLDRPLSFLYATAITMLDRLTFFIA